MVGKERGGVAGFGGAKPTRRLATSGVAIASSQAAVPRKRVEIGAIQSEQEMITASAQALTVDEVTNVAPARAKTRTSRLSGRLPLPAPLDAQDEEDEFTDVHFQKLAVPELAEISLAEQILRAGLRDGDVKAGRQESGLTQTKSDPGELHRERHGSQVAFVVGQESARETAETKGVTRSKAWIALPLVVLLALGVYPFVRSESGASVDGIKVIEAPIEVGEVSRAQSTQATPSNVDVLPEPDGLAVRVVAVPSESQPLESVDVVAQSPSSQPSVEKKLEPTEIATNEAGQNKDGAAKRDQEARLAGAAKQQRFKGKVSSAPAMRESAQVLYKKGTTAFVAGKLAAAEREFQSALRVDPGYALAHRALGLVYERQGHGAKAVTSFRRYLKRAPRANDSNKIKIRIERLGG